MSDYIGKGLIDTGWSRLLFGQNTLEKWEQMLTRRWGLSTQRMQLAKAMTFRFDNGETLETRTLAILPVRIAGVNGVLRVYVVPGRAPLLLSKEFLRDLGCHIDLGRGHLFSEKLGVRTVVASKQSPHMLPPLTSFGPQGHKIPAEIQPRISSDEAPDRTKYIRGSPQHPTTNHLKLTAPTLNFLHRTDEQDRRKVGESAQYRETDTIRPNAR